MVGILRTLQGLKNYGFQQLTSWVIRKGKIKPETLDWDDCSGWIYAFASGVSIRYIGIATTVLRSRLDGYSYQLNDPVGAKIKETIESGVGVEILGVKRPHRAKSELGEEESMLIKRFDPDWNVRR